MNFKKNGGFTLVELIVVIAILGLLAGIGIPAYGKYVEKAQIAVDEQNIVMLHNAFVVACVGNDVDPATVTVLPAHINWNESTKTFLGLNNVQRAGTDPIVDDFNAFIGAEGVQFKKYGPSDIAKGLMDPDSITVHTYEYGGGVIKVTKAQVEALKNSTFYGEGMTSQKLMDQVNMVASIAGGMGTITNVMQTEGYVNAALKALGLEPSGDPVEDGKRLNAEAERLAMQKLGITEVTADNQTAFNNLKKQISNNALVIYTAQSTTQLGTEEAKTLLNGVTSEMIKNAMDGNLEGVDTATGMNQAALAYGMYYAYVNSDACTKELEKTNIVPTDVIKALDENDEFRTYMNSDQGTKDMEAYLKALEVVSGSADSSEAVKELVVEGFNDPDLVAILQDTMGK